MVAWWTARLPRLAGLALAVAGPLTLALNAIGIAAALIAHPDAEPG